MLPNTLDITTTLSDSLTFDGSLTARDRALLFAVSWYASRNPPQDGGEEVYVPDLAMRRVLGDMRRPDERWEIARYVRLEHAQMRTDESMPDMSEGVLVPTVPQGSRRVTVAGQRQWLVDERIRRSFAVEPGDVVVGVPVTVLAKARSRYTLPLLLRLLAWGGGGYPRKWLRRQTDTTIVLRVPIAEMRAAIGSDPGVYAVDFLRREIQPAIDEIRMLTDLAVDVAPVNAPSLRKPKAGRVMFYDLLISKSAARVVPRPEPTQPPAEIIAFPSKRPPFAAFKPLPALRKLGPAAPAKASFDDDSPF